MRGVTSTAATTCSGVEVLISIANDDGSLNGIESPAFRILSVGAAGRDPVKVAVLVDPSKVWKFDILNTRPDRLMLVNEFHDEETAAKTKLNKANEFHDGNTAAKAQLNETTCHDAVDKAGGEVDLLNDALAMRVLDNDSSEGYVESLLAAKLRKHLNGKGASDETKDTLTEAVFKTKPVSVCKESEKLIVMSSSMVRRGKRWNKLRPQLLAEWMPFVNAALKEQEKLLADAERMECTIGLNWGTAWIAAGYGAAWAFAGWKAAQFGAYCDGAGGNGTSIIT